MSLSAGEARQGQGDFRAVRANGYLNSWGGLKEKARPYLYFVPDVQVYVLPPSLCRTAPLGLPALGG